MGNKPTNLGGTTLNDLNPWKHWGFMGSSSMKAKTPWIHMAGGKECGFFLGESNCWTGPSDTLLVSYSFYLIHIFLIFFGREASSFLNV
jgi:hypothetical protein